MQHKALISVLLAATALAGCAVPRGAAYTEEILKEEQDETSSYQVVRVTRANLAAVQGWPVPGTGGIGGWLSSGSGGGGQTIRAGDTLDLVVWDSEPNSLLASGGQRSVKMEGLRVTPNGEIFVPYVGNIGVSGLSPDGARDKVEEALLKIVPSAQLQINLREGKANSVDVVSGVARPGSYPLPDRNTTILSMLAQAGGIGGQVANPIVRLIRDGQSYEIHAARLFETASADAVLRGGDKIVVEPDQRYFTAIGAAGRETLAYFPKADLNAMEAIAVMGGLSETRSNAKGVLVLRDYPGSALRPDGSGPNRQQVVFAFDLTNAEGLFAARGFSVQAKDTVLVTEASLTGTETILGALASALLLRERIQAN